MQLRLISPASQAALLLCLCLLGCLPFLAPASPGWGLLSSLPAPSPLPQSFIMGRGRAWKGQERMVGRESRENHQNTVEKRRVREHGKRWRGFLLSSEGELLTEPLRMHFCLCPQPDKWETLLSCFHTKRGLSIAHICIFAMARTVPTVP